MTTTGDADLAAVGSLLADRSRCRMLLALLGGRCLPASMLAAEAGVSGSTASSHLAKLTRAGFVGVQTRGRYRYYSLTGPPVAQLLEGLAGFAPHEEVRSLRAGTRAEALRRARSCYDHLAGRLGVTLTAAMATRGWLHGIDDGDGTPLPARASGATDALTATMTDAGRRGLAAIGVQLPDAAAVRCCVDWTEQRPHLAGPHGRALFARLGELGWVERAPQGRAVLVTGSGRQGFGDTFGLRA